LTAYIFKRVLAVIPILIFVGVLTFSLVHLAPGDAANIMAGDYAGPDDVKIIRAELGLDKPVTTQKTRKVKSAKENALTVVLSEYTKDIIQY